MSTIYKCDKCGTIGERISFNSREENYEHKSTDVASFRLTMGANSQGVTQDICVSCIKKSKWDHMLTKSRSEPATIQGMLVDLLADEVADEVAGRQA